MVHSEGEMMGNKELTKMTTNSAHFENEVWVVDIVAPSTDIFFGNPNHHNG